MSRFDLVSKGFVYVPRVIFNKLNRMAGNRTITNKQFRLVLIIIAETIAWKVGKDGKPSRHKDAVRKTHCYMSHADFERRLGVKGNLKRDLTKLVHLGIIRVEDAENSRGQKLYYFEQDPSKWRLPANGVEQTVPTQEGERPTREDDGMNDLLSELKDL